MPFDPDEMNCPKCGEECWRDSVDVGVGYQYGPWGCPGCGWSESKQYDHSEGKTAPAQTENPEWYVDQWGRMTRKSAMKERVSRFGLNPDIIDEVFGPEKS
jgi:hypothetical protein